MTYLLVRKFENSVVIIGLCVDLVLCQKSIKGELHFSLSCLEFKTKLKFLLSCVDFDKVFEQFLWEISSESIGACHIIDWALFLHEISLLNGFDEIDIEIDVILLDFFLLDLDVQFLFQFVHFLKYSELMVCEICFEIVHIKNITSLNSIHPSIKLVP